MANEYVIQAKNVTKIYGKNKVVDSVNLNIEKGSIYGLIGRNGAGKTTILKMIAGLSQTSRGEIAVFGKTGMAKSKVMGRIGTLIEEPGLYTEMSAYDNLRMKAIALGVDKKEYLNEILEIVGLSNTGNKKAGRFSLGMRQRLGIGIALVGSPDLLVLDEPINGLDPQGIAEVRETILKLNREKHMTVIISSHILEELSKLVTHFGIIDHGVMIEELTKEELSEKCTERIEIVVDDTEKACTIIEKLGIRDYKVVENYHIRVFERLNDTATINKALIQGDVQVSQISLTNEDVEAYFLNVTSEGGIR